MAMTRFDNAGKTVTPSEKASIASDMPGPQIHDDDEFDELPPLDGDARDKPEGELDDAVLLEDEAEDATLDDATGENEPPDTSDLDLEKVEGGWLGEAGEASEIDRDDLAMTDFGEEPLIPGDEGVPGASGRGQDRDEEPGVGDEDFGLDTGPEHGGLDAGDEGPFDADEELKESDLPVLDADGESEWSETSLFETSLPAEEPLGLAWAPEPWLRVGAPVPLVGSTAVACAGPGALVAGRSESGAAELDRVDLEGTCERLLGEGMAAAETRALTADGHQVAAVLQSGRLLISSDGGSHFSPVAGASAEGVAVSSAVFASGRLWARTRAGGLVFFDPGMMPGSTHPLGHRPLERWPLPGLAAALTGDTIEGQAAAAVLVVDDARRPTSIVHVSSSGTTRRDVLDAPEAESPAIFAARGECVAYAARPAGLVRKTGDSAWQTFDWGGRIAALSFIDGQGTLVACSYSDLDDTSTLVRLDAAGASSIVARVGAAQGDAESDGCVMAMAHDEARGVLWVAGGFGVVAFAIR